MKHDYTKLDAAILAALKDAPLTFTAMQGNAEVRKEVGLIEAKHNEGLLRRDSAYKPGWRFLDSRLQALRKAGKVGFDTKQGWTLK